MFSHRASDDVSLHLLELHDAPELFRVVDDNRDHLRAWLPWVDATRAVEHVTAFITRTRQQYADNNGFQTSIRYRDALVGVIGFHGGNGANRSTALGYWLAADAQGHGVMTTACRAYLTHAFEVMNINRVEIRAAVGNSRSRAIPERLGFSCEGTIRQAEWLYDHFVDHAVYGLLSEEWKEGGR